MAFGNTEDTRIHVLGDMVMLTGTFTDGGTEVSFDSQLTEVFAAGGHLTSLTSTLVNINEALGYTPGTATALTVEGADARAALTVGQTLYTADTGQKIGVLTAINSATEIIVAGGTGALLANDQVFAVRGAFKPSITLQSVGVDVSIDEANSLVLFEVGKVSATATTSASDGRWWILGKR
tara:strand:- start:340 stop:879 length:540 start_codon:yes stop_codon:yes gene_type:complete